MKKVLLLLGLIGCELPKEPPKEYKTYEVTCPINMITTRVDTLRNMRSYWYERNRLGVWGFGGGTLRQYPQTCVMKEL